MTSTAEILRGLPYFTDLPDDLLSRVCDASEQLSIPEGRVIIEEGSTSEEMYVVVEGELAVTKRSGDKNVELGRIGPGEVVGEIALLDQAPRTATVSALMNSYIVRLPVSAFEDLLSDSRVVRRMFKTVTSRLRGIEDTLRHEERMAALGKMAAQLMHELNNPAAAVARSVQELERIQGLLGEEARALAGEFWGGDFGQPPPREHELSALDRSDAESDLVTWLERAEVPDPWDLAPALVDAGWDAGRLDEGLSDVPEAVRRRLARWIGLRASADQVLGELGIGARRIAELVRVVKEYSFLDRAPIQEVDVTNGIRDTLILLKHKLRNVEVTQSFSEDLHKVEAPGRDLNQVWTNLIDNSADAMAEEGGSLSISAHNDGDNVVVEVADTGGGVPPEVADRIFDPFFTTKEPGKGTGLGLHTVQTIIGRVGGNISVSSDEVGTTFVVTLPAAV
ncbi:MAG TPA: ATP-binding protein [Acidimicrobiia bacterium]|nr:ATP-binding protein [Acidimicrobiia bacterium]